MAGRVRRVDQAKLWSDLAIQNIASELREARRSAGLSQLAVARAARGLAAKVARMELAKQPDVSLAALIRVGAMVGLRVSVRAYQAGEPIRDAAQTRLLSRCRDRLGDGWTWRYEVPVALGDQRAWDACATRAGSGTVAIEAETRIRDVQALLRRIALKQEAAGHVRVVLFVADSHGDRHALAAGRHRFAAELPMRSRAARRALCAGMVPASDSLIVLGPDRSARFLRASAPSRSGHESSSA